jgi:hypothetical protein
MKQSDALDIEMARDFYKAMFDLESKYGVSYVEIQKAVRRVTIKLEE